MPKIQVDNISRNGSSTTRREKALKNQEQLVIEARERRQQTIIGVIVVIIVIAMLSAIGVTTYQAVYAPMQMKIEQSDKSKNELKKLSAKYKPKMANAEGGILMSKLGYNKPAGKAPTVAVYFDPLCPGCGEFNRTADKTLFAMLKAGQINLELHPMSFLDQFSAGSYSSRVTSSIEYIAENDDNPEHLMRFINNIFSKDFQPEEGKKQKPVSNEQLIEQAKKAGIDASVASKAFERRYLVWQRAINKYVPDFLELLNVSGPSKGSMTTPTVTINGKLLDINAASEKNMKTLDAILHCIGLNKNQVGVAGEMPKVSNTESPISL